MSELSSPIPAPYPLAMIICDAIHVDPGTGKRTLLGCFTSIAAKQFPVAVPALAVYAAITDCRGKMPIVLQLVNLADEEVPVLRIEGEFELDDPLAVLEMDFRMGNVVIPSPGEYRFQLFAADEPMLERRLIVLQLPESER